MESYYQNCGIDTNRQKLSGWVELMIIIIFIYYQYIFHTPFVFASMCCFQRKGHFPPTLFTIDGNQDADDNANTNDEDNTSHHTTNNGASLRTWKKQMLMSKKKQDGKRGGTAADSAHTHAQ